MNIFRSTWPRYSKRLAALAKENGLSYSLVEVNDKRRTPGRFHCVYFNDYYLTGITASELLKKVKQELKKGGNV